MRLPLSGETKGPPPLLPPELLAAIPSIFVSVASFTLTSKLKTRWRSEGSGEGVAPVVTASAGSAPPSNSKADTAETLRLAGFEQTLQRSGNGIGNLPQRLTA